ncbi:hypothetical protein [Lysinibacillus sp. RC79]|uniref:hypothetical protein n=1 Tax=Lysinibacillus sp. RC79 TaxID=3156296 RepID=UPI0035151683
MNQQFMAFINFLRSSSYGCLAMLIYVQITCDNDVLSAFVSKYALKLTLFIAILEVIVAGIPQKLKES